MEDEGSAGSGGMSALLGVNSLDYRMAPSLSVFTTRTMRSWPAGNSSYSPGSEMSFTLSSGAAYIDPKNSYIQFKLFLDKQTTAPSGTVGWSLSDGTEPVTGAGAINLFDSYYYNHSSGYELDRLNGGMGTLATLKGAHRMSAGKTKTVTSLYNTVPAMPTVEASKETTYLIPLSELSGIFDTDTILPGFMVAGSRLNIKLKSNINNALVIGTTGLTPGSWEIRDAEINLCCLTPTDAVVRALSMQSASTGLEIPFERTFMTSVSQVEKKANVSVQVTRALSRANAIIVAPVDGSANGVVTKDYNSPLKGSDTKITSFQVKLGAETMPAQPARGLLAFYHQTLEAFGAFRTQLGSGVTTADFDAKAFCLTQTLEKSSTLSQSGSSIAANRDLNMEITLEATSPALEHRVFVPHVALATVFLDSVIVRS